VLVTRIAPTPSGYLHVGNAVNFVLTHWMARARGGRLLLRIDDFDTGRARLAYLEEVFRTLDWLDIDIDDGPSGPADFHSSWSMSTRIDQFRHACDRLVRAGHDSVFVCRCSRHDLDADGRCAAGCREQGLALAPGSSALRITVPAGSERGLPLQPGDHVLWRRDDLPAYQLGSVVADEDLAVTAIVRGVDLLESSALQLHLAGLLPAPGFQEVALHHHALLTAPGGHKLSKSAGAQAHPLQHTDHLREAVLTWAQELGTPIGISRP
jgi:glutamyl-tRNA synthetase